MGLQRLAAAAATSYGLQRAWRHDGALSRADHFLRFAELYRGAKQPEAALDWAERGVKAFPKNTDVRLLVFLADAYDRCKRHGDALALIWRPFETQPSLEGYRLLKSHADRAEAWPEWRDRALDHLRKEIAHEAGSSPRAKHAAFWGISHRSTLVRIFLWEKDAESAWLEAKDQSLSRELWLEVAAAREQDNPADVIPVYLREAEALVVQTGQRSYEAARAHLRKLKALQERLNRSAEWTVLIARLRVIHKAKRNFIALINGL